MNKEKIELEKPEKCHLWQKDDLLEQDLNPRTFKEISVFIDDSHFKRKLLECKDCGQLYFYQFTESIDYIGGNDPQHGIFIPVKSREDADRISKLNSMEIYLYQPRLLSDFPEDADKPIVKWIKGD